MIEDHLGRALHQQHLAASPAVEGRHELVFGFERNSVDPRRGGGFRRTVHAELGGEGIERALGRITLDLPLAVVLENFGIVTQQRYAAHQHQRFGQVADRLTVRLHLALGRVAVSRDLIGFACRDDGGHHHLHQRQRTRLVRADA